MNLVVLISAYPTAVEAINQLIYSRVATGSEKSTFELQWVSLEV